MAALHSGDVVLLVYPYTSLDGSKRRPALVLLDCGNRDFLFARLTSGPTRDTRDVVLTRSSEAGLTLPTTCRLTKLVTLSEDLVLREFGQIAAEDRELVAESLSQLFSLDWPTPGL